MGPSVKVSRWRGRRCGKLCAMATGRCLAPSNSASTAMRTNTPLATCSRISDCAPSATSAAISTPRLIGPGCMTRQSGARAPQALRGQAVTREIFRFGGNRRRFHALFLQAQHDGDVDAGDRLVEIVENAAIREIRRRPAASCGGAHRRSSATPSARNACTSERATREWRMSPQMTTRSAEKSGRCRRSVKHVEQALGRMRVIAVAGVEHGGARVQMSRNDTRACRIPCGARRTHRNASLRACAPYRAGFRP